MRLTSDYVCENAREAPGKKTKEIYFLYFRIYLPLTLAVNLSRFLFSYARSTISVVNRVGVWKCIQRIYWSMIWSPAFWGSSEKSPKSRTRKEARVRGKRKVRLFRFVWAKSKWKFIRDRGKLFFFLRISRPRPSRARSLAARFTSTNAGNTCFLPFSLFGCIVQSEISVLTVKASKNIPVLSLSLVLINQYASVSSNFIYVIRAKKTKVQQNKTIRTKRAKNECTAFVEFNIRTC